MDKNYTITKKEMSLPWRRRIAYAVLILISFFCLIWFFILFINSTRSNGELARGFTPFPSKNLLVNFHNLRTKSSLPIMNGLFNSLLVSCGNAALCVYFSTLTAYAIHAYKFKGRQAMFTFILAIMMIPGQVTALGFLQLINRIGLDDNLLALILPSMAAPVTFFYIKQYMDSNLPLEIVEAARIDGSGEFSTFNRIILPIMKPALAVQAIFTFVSSWNNYFVPALVMHTDKKKTLPILIAQLRAADYMKFDMGQVYIFITLSILPVIVIYLLLSKHIVGGVTAGGVKG